MNIQQLGTLLARNFSDPGASVLAIEKTPPVGLLARGWRWLEARSQGARSQRRLQLCATMSLGEKRFLSIISCDGQQFLIGGGAENVALLAHVADANLSNVPAIRAEGAQ